MMVKSRRDKDGAGPNFGRKQLEIKLTVFFFFFGASAWNSNLDFLSTQTTKWN